MSNSRSDQLLELLLHKHSKDLCVPECKTGPTLTSSKMQKLDLWVMKKSWSNFCTYGYEIKISRGDFLHDDKWKNYLNYCTDFYFVVPNNNILSINEIPPGVGLLVSSQNLTRLYMKRKAVSRNVEIPISVFIYILMWRVKILRNYYSDSIDKSDYWKRWLQKKDEKKELGFNVSKKIKEIMEKRIWNIEVENHRLEAENKKLDGIKQTLETLGIEQNEIYAWNLQDKVRNRIKEIETGIPEGLTNYIDNTIKNLQEIKKVFK